MTTHYALHSADRRMECCGKFIDDLPDTDTKVLTPWLADCPSAFVDIFIGTEAGRRQYVREHGGPLHLIQRPEQLHGMRRIGKVIWQANVYEMLRLDIIVILRQQIDHIKQMQAV